jgi:hypothetical protein
LLLPFGVLSVSSSYSRKKLTGIDLRLVIRDTKSKYLRLKIILVSSKISYSSNSSVRTKKTINTRYVLDAFKRQGEGRVI